MTRGKKIFAMFALLFVVFIIYVSYDISSRTTFPGSKPQLKERIEDNFFTGDSVKRDSINEKK